MHRACLVASSLTTATSSLASVTSFWREPIGLPVRGGGRYGMRESAGCGRSTRGTGHGIGGVVGTSLGFNYSASEPSGLE